MTGYSIGDDRCKVHNLSVYAITDGITCRCLCLVDVVKSLKLTYHNQILLRGYKFTRRKTRIQGLVQKVTR